MDSSEKSRLLQPAPPMYQENPGHSNAGYPDYPGRYQGQPNLQRPYPGQRTVTVQPAVYVTSIVMANPVPDYIGYSIFIMLCCCLPLGVAALIYSIHARDASISGDRQTALENSRIARILNHVGLGIGLTAYVVCIICIFAVKNQDGHQKYP